MGAATDGALIGDRWSYREGRLTFMNFFHNKAFRWGLDRAELILPVVPGADHRVRINALLRTAVAIEVEGEVVETLNPSSDGVRWHDDDIGFTIPGRLASGPTVRIRFLFIGDNWKNLEFNLRQEGFTLGRIVVDSFGRTDPELPMRLARTIWRDLAAGSVLARDFLAERQPDLVCQTAILVSKVEFDLVDRYFAPQQHFWCTLLGLADGLLSSGASVVFQSTAAMSVEQSTSVVVGPLRFDIAAHAEASAALSAAPAGEENCGVILSLSTSSLALCGLGVGSELLGTFAYRELYNVAFEPGRLSNYWEMIVSQPDYWQAVELNVYENVLLGRISTTRALVLASGCAEDWLENGSVDSRFVLDRFCKAVAGPAALRAGNRPCAVNFVSGRALVALLDERFAVRSQGGGIGRGFPAFQGPTNDLAPITQRLEAGDASEVHGIYGQQMRRLVAKVSAEPFTVVSAGVRAAVLDIDLDAGAAG